MNRSISRLVSALLLTAGMTGPALAQSMAIPDLPWGSTPATAARYFTSHGYTVPADTANSHVKLPRIESTTYISGGHETSARFLDDHLVAVVRYESFTSRLTAGSRAEILVDSLKTIYGRPSDEDSTAVGWFESQEGIQVGIATDLEGHSQTVLERSGPGYDIYLEHVDELYYQVVDELPDRYPKLSERWKTAYEDDEIRISIASNPVIRSATRIRIWERWDYATPRHHEGDNTTKAFNYDTASEYTEYDCSGRRSRSYALTFHLDGEVQHSTTDDDTPGSWNLIGPETVGEAVMQAACKLLH